MESNLVTLKDMNSGEQKQVTTEELIETLSK
jgi:histidyl-tRNA synthetase